MTGEPANEDPATADRSADATELALKKLWIDLHQEQIGTSERFIDFTDSISAEEYATRVSEKFNIDISGQALLGELSSVAELAKAITAAQAQEQSVSQDPASSYDSLDGESQAGATEAVLHELWLEIDDSAVAKHDRFIDFTDSISAAEYANRVRERFQLEVTPNDLLGGDISTLAQLATFIDSQNVPATKAPASSGVAARPRESATDLSTTPSAHLLPLPGGRWRIWKHSVLRGAGFPVSLVQVLAAGRSAQAADLYLDTRRIVVEERRRWLKELGLALKTAAPNERTRLRAVRRRVMQSRLRPEDAEGTGRALASALRARAAAFRNLIDAFRQDSDNTTGRLRTIADDRRFREAALWQNRGALAQACAKLDSATASAGDRRNAATFIAMLLQRFAAKNDSLGFFGPVGWATLAEAPFSIDLRPGRDLLAAREVYFEGWAIDALARRLAQLPGIRPWCAPRVKAGVWLTPEFVYRPVESPLALSPQEHAVIALCDGIRTARQIAALVQATTPYTAHSPDDVYRILDRLASQGLVVWTLEVAAQRYPERELALRISRIDDPELRSQCEDALATLTEARQAIADAAGDVERLERSLADLDAKFVAITGESPTRRAGAMYAGRALVFEDCRRDCDAVLGGPFLERLGPPLSIVLDAVRWVSVELRRGFTAHLKERHAELQRKLRTNTVDAHLFVTHVGASAREALAPLSAAVKAAFQSRWRDVLDASDVPPGHSLVRSTNDLRARAAHAFAVDGPSNWAGYFTPDIMVASPSLAAFQRGEFQCVLGEVHSNNTLLWSALTAQHPDPAALLEALAADTHDRTIVVMQVPNARWLSRLSPLALRSFWRYEYGDDPPSASPVRSLPAGRLLVREDGKRLVVTARDGVTTFDAYELFAVTMSYEADRIASEMLPPSAHTPRITIDQLIVHREQWRFTPSQMPFLAETEPAAQFAHFRGWARSHQLPRYFFFKSPGETKPCYVDQHSPLFVEAFSKLMRRLRPDATVRVVEMCPSIDEAWLVDGSGAVYTSEIRIAAREPH
jgi:acyl carrier protein